MLLVSSRNFGVTVNGTGTNVMVPLSDMLNHASPYQASWTYNNDRGGFQMTAEMDIKQDEEIFDSYGGKSSYNFLLHYAFIFEDKDGRNDKDIYPIWLGLRSADELLDLKESNFIDEDKIGSREFDLS